MQANVEIAVKASWGALSAYWLISSRGIKVDGRREAAGLRFIKYWLPLLAAIALIGPGHWYGEAWLHERFRPQGAVLDWLGAAVLAVGVGLACWARWLLGRNWSVSVTLKQDHELIQRGPYRVVRHPIYTGVITAFLGTALAIGEWRGCLAALIVAGSFWFKLRLEERWLGEQFGERYARYKRDTKALFPGVI